jgi:hypothetical protein
LSVALAAAQSEGPRVAFVDEVGRLDRGNLSKFVERLCSLVESGQLDNAVLTATEPLPGLHTAPWMRHFAQVEIKE